MAINISTDGNFTGRFTAPSAAYPFGSAKNETSAGAGDGTPYILIRANDIFGFQQALLESAGIVPSGSADTALVSEYGQALVEIASGRAITYDDSGDDTDYVADLKTDQQGPRSYFPFMQAQFVIGNTNAGAATVDINGNGELPIQIGGVALVGGEMVSGALAQLTLNAGANAAELSVATGTGGGIVVAHDKIFRSDRITTTSVIGYDTSQPQIGEGALALTLPAFTPDDALNRLIVRAGIFLSSDSASFNHNITAIFRDATLNAIVAGSHFNESASREAITILEVEFVAGSITPTVFTLRFGPEVAFTSAINGDGGQKLGASSITWLSVTEYLPA